MRTRARETWGPTRGCPTRGAPRARTAGAESNDPQLFFAERDAAETLIWLVAASAAPYSPPFRSTATTLRSLPDVGAGDVWEARAPQPTAARRPPRPPAPGAGKRYLDDSAGIDTEGGVRLRIVVEVAGVPQVPEKGSDVLQIEADAAPAALQDQPLGDGDAAARASRTAGPGSSPTTPAGSPDRGAAADRQPS